MANKINQPAVIEAAGNKPKLIEEYFGRVNTKDEKISIAKMKSPAGWTEPGQQPEFDEYTIVISGELIVKTEDGNELIINPGEAVIAHKNEWVRYSTPNEATEYIAICLPAFSPENVNRDK